MDEPNRADQDVIRAAVREEMIESAARIAHEVNRAYCNALGDASQPDWNDAPTWQKESAKIGMRMHAANPEATAEDSHKAWMAVKESEGWVYGEHKDPVKKTHPCMLPYRELPREQRIKDYLFKAVAYAIFHQPLITEETET